MKPTLVTGIHASHIMSKRKPEGRVVLRPGARATDAVDVEFYAVATCGGCGGRESLRNFMAPRGEHFYDRQLVHPCPAETPEVEVRRVANEVAEKGKS